jgi:uncharacterized protein (TIGR02246 family)
MISRLILTFMGIGTCLVVLAANNVLRAEEKNDSSVIIGIERAAMERWAKGDPDGFLQILSPDILFFDSSLTSRADGIEVVRKLYEQERGKVNVEVEFINPKVQFAGDAAVLTFNLITRDRTPERRERRWHATEVFQKTNGTWCIIHGHYSLAKVD